MVTTNISSSKTNISFVVGKIDQRLFSYKKRVGEIFFFTFSVLQKNWRKRIAVFQKIACNDIQRIYLDLSLVHPQLKISFFFQNIAKAWKMKYLRALIYIYCYVEQVPGGGRHLLQLNLPRYSNKCEAFLNTNISSSALLLLDKVWNCCETSAIHFWKQMWFHLKYPPEHFIAPRFCNRSFQFQISLSSPYSDNKQTNKQIQVICQYLRTIQQFY